jgi:hypothetical protein
MKLYKQKVSLHDLKRKEWNHWDAFAFQLYDRMQKWVEEQTSSTSDPNEEHTTEYG